MKTKIITIKSELQNYLESKYNRYLQYNEIVLSDDNVFWGIKNEGSNQIRTKLCTLKQAESWHNRTNKAIWK